jgi:hypothetical protein
VSGDPQFSNPVQVPDGFPGYALPVPHPTDGRLYVKLRDDPSVVDTASLSAQQLPPSPDESVQTLARQAAVRDLAQGTLLAPKAPASVLEGSEFWTARHFSRTIAFSKRMAR